MAIINEKSRYRGPRRCRRQGDRDEARLRLLEDEGDGAAVDEREAGGGVEEREVHEEALADLVVRDDPRRGDEQRHDQRDHDEGAGGERGVERAEEGGDALDGAVAGGGADAEEGGEALQPLGLGGAGGTDVDEVGEDEAETATIATPTQSVAIAQK